MARISIMGPSGRQERQLFRHNSLGRHPRNTHQVLDRVVSKEHCHIELIEDRYILKDLGSLNGTYVHRLRAQGKARRRLVRRTLERRVSRSHQPFQDR
ncbi:MAG: FHA domain-containing protein [Deltaproteobacteria bacterium]|nr:FHA domain-containing protein [Deltaproteobacteria bacterium]